MKKVILCITGLLSVGAYGVDNNLPDSVDENIAPAQLEERKNEPINKSDPVDTNYVPATEEERQEEEFIDADSDVLDRDAIDDEAD